jgi:hypothetical protein
MKATLLTPFRIIDAAIHCLLTIPAVPAGHHRFLWICATRGLGGNGGNGKLTVGLGGPFAGNPGGPAADVVSNGLSQAASLTADGTSSLQLPSGGATLGAGTPPPQELTTHGTLAGCTQTGSFTLAAPSDVQIYCSPDAFDAADVQEIADLILIVEPVVP